MTRRQTHIHECNTHKSWQKSQLVSVQLLQWFCVTLCRKQAHHHLQWEKNPGWFYRYLLLLRRRNMCLVVRATLSMFLFEPLCSETIAKYFNTCTHTAFVSTVKQHFIYRAENHHFFFSALCSLELRLFVREKSIGLLLCFARADFRHVRMCVPVLVCVPD